MAISGYSESTLLINDVENHQIHNKQGKLKNCFIAVCERYPIEDLDKCARHITKTTGAAISAIAKIPYIPIALKLGNLLGPISSVGNTAGFFILEYWAINGTANDLFGPKTDAEIELLHGETRKSRVCRKVVIISISTLIALSSQLPTALAGIVYNSNEYKLAAGLVLMVAGALIPIRSLQLSVEKIRKNIQMKMESETAKIKAKMVALIRDSHGVFIQKSYEKKIAYVEKCNEIRSLDIPVNEKADQYALALFQKNLLPVNQTKKIIGNVFNYTGLGLGVALAGIFEFALGQYTFEVANEEVWDNDAASGTFAALAVGSAAYLFGSSIINTTQRIFNVFGNLVTGKEVRNLGWQLRPKLSFALTAIGLLIEASALGPTYVIWGDFYDQNEVEHQLFQKSMCTSLFLLLFTSTLDLIDEIVSFSIARGTAEEQEILKINGEFQKLAELIDKCSSREFMSYITGLDVSTREELLDRMNLSANQLEIYAENIDV